MISYLKTFHLNNMKLKHKLILMIAVVSIVISAFTVFGFSYAISQYNKLVYSQTASSLSFFSDELTHQLENMETASSYIAFDAIFQDSLKEVNASPKWTLSAQEAKKDIIDLFNRSYTPDMVHITVLTNTGASFWWGKSALNESESSMEKLLASCDSADGQIVWSISDNKTDILCARRVLRVKNLSLEPMGYLIIQTNLEDIVHSLLKSRYAGGSQFQIFISGEEQLIYPADNDNYSAYYKQLSSSETSYAIKKIAGSRMFITFSRLPLKNAEWSISLGAPYDDIFYSLRLLVPMFIFSLLLAVFIAFSLAGYIVKNISKQFHILVGKMDRVNLEGIMENDIVSALPTTSQDEMTVLNSYFDQMIVELKKLIEESYVKQLLITQAELKALEQQVNPHFLYNTLNSINWLAKKAGAKDISTIAESLGSMLQNTLSGGQTVITLERELEIVTCYVKIQQIRFDDLVVESDIDPSLLQAQIPKMTIQPLVENAILHSQEEPQDEYLIRLTAKRSGHPGKDNETIVIRIENSGSHIDENILEHIRDHTVTPKGNGIGLTNIDSRLRIVFGDAYHLHFENINGMAVVWFEIPYSETGSTIRKEL